MQFVSKQSNEIGPLNVPTQNTYSFRNGFPLVSFKISEMPQILIGNSMRLNGVLKVRSEAGALPDNFNAKSTGEKSGAVSNRAGVFSCFDQLTMSTLSNQTMEHIRNWGRYVANTTQMTKSQSDMDLNQGLMTLMSSRSGTTARGVNVDRFFSIPVLCGLNSQNYSLAMDGTRGLMVQFQLSPDQVALNGYYDSANTYQNLTQDGWYYEMSDLTLSFDTIVPDADTQRAMMTPKSSSMEFTSIQNIYSDITSSDATINLNLNSSRVLDCQSTFIGVSQINNYANDSFIMPKLQTAVGTDAEIKRISYLRGAQLFPFVDELDTEDEAVQSRLLTEVYVPSISAFEDYEKLTSTMLCNASELGFETSVNPVSGTDDDRVVLPDRNVKNFSVSTSQDVYNVGLNYKNTTYGLRIVSNLPGTFSNGVFTYVKSLNTLQKDAQGNVMVMN